MNAAPLHSAALGFAQREVLRTRASAHRAIAHADAVGDLPIPELQEFAHRSVELTVDRFRNAIGKRAFEIRELTK
jgi:hypothetical protein